MPTLTHTQLRDRLQQAACVAVSLDCVQNMDEKNRMRKTGNPFLGQGVEKESTFGGLVGGRYANFVDNQAGREDKEDMMGFEPQPRKWGERVGNLVTHKGKWYVEMGVKSHGGTRYVRNGVELTGADLDLLKSFIPEKKTAKTQDHLKTKVVWRDVGLDTIRRIRAWGQEWNVVPDGYKVDMETSDETSDTATADEPATV